MDNILMHTEILLVFNCTDLTFHKFSTYFSTSHFNNFSPQYIFSLYLLSPVLLEDTFN